MQSQAQTLNRGFVSRVTRGRPWARMKIAASLDGRTALHNGQSQWITGAAARDDGHHWRARACAVLTGIGTVKDDDPQLNVRAVDTSRQPLRIVIDSRLETPPEARILEGGNVLIACAVEDKERAARLSAKGAEIVVIPNAAGKVELPQLMRELARREINELHIEAGNKLNGSLINEGCVDELLLYLAPSLLGDRAQGMANLPELNDLAQRRRVIAGGSAQQGEGRRPEVAHRRALAKEFGVAVVAQLWPELAAGMLLQQRDDAGFRRARRHRRAHHHRVRPGLGRDRPAEIGRAHV